MIEIILLTLAWYAIGLLSMLYIQYWTDKMLVDERKVFPGQTPNIEVSTQEVWVLALLGPVVSCGILYTVLLMWWLTRNDND